MARISAVLLGAAASCIAGGLAACRAPLPAAAHADQGTPAECPARLRGQLRISASAAPLALPGERAMPAADAGPQELLGRRLLLAAAPLGTAAGTRVLSSTLTVAVVGGMFGGPASPAEPAGAAAAADGAPAARLPSPREVAPGRALEIEPGALRIAPFFASSRLRPQSLTLDVTVVPGGMPGNRMIASLPPLWTSAAQPVEPADAAPTVRAEQHLTVFSAVEARLELDVDGTGGSDAPGVWRCTYETRFTLLDHPSVLPPLWDLQLSAPGPARWLALFDTSVGPFRAIFSDPAAAQAFAAWLQATSASRAGRYQLGFFEADPDQLASMLPTDREIGSTFKAATADELRHLTVRRLGED